MHFNGYPEAYKNYKLFVPKTFRSQERKVPMENFRFPATKVPGTFVPGTFRSRELSFLGNESSLELSFSGPFVLGNFRSRGGNFLGTFVPGPFVPENFRSHYPIGLVAALLCVLNYCMFGCDGD